MNLNKFTVFHGKNIISESVNVINTEIGFASYIGPKSDLPFCHIGKYSSIGPRVRVIQGMHPTRKFVSTHPSFFSDKMQSGFSFVNKSLFEEYAFSSKKNHFFIDIGNDVWIGSDVIILSGISINDGSIIASGSVVTKNIGSYEIWGGNPAQLIRKRFTDDEIYFLKDILWWNTEFSVLELQAKYFSDIKDLAAYYEKHQLRQK
ncbi:MAG: CatB-related O-acetyltransferase [Bacteroidales bacterium]|nr:CatB-related O-acetyltransferase [Bacteroidales bacterium]